MSVLTVTPPTLYTQLGGRTTIALVVDDFYQRVLTDERVRAFFAGLDIDRQVRHLAAFVGFALGGPNDYKGRTLREAHRGLDITLAQFTAVAGHLQGALLACGVPEETTATIIAAVANLQADVVGQ